MLICCQSFTIVLEYNSARILPVSISRHVGRHLLRFIIEYSFVVVYMTSIMHRLLVLTLFIIPFYADIRYYLVRKRLSVHFPTLFIPEVALGRFGSAIG